MILNQQPLNNNADLMNIRDPSRTLQRGEIENFIEDDHTHDTNKMNLSGVNNDGTNAAIS